MAAMMVSHCSSIPQFGHFNEDITSERMYRIGSFYIITFSLVTFQKAENSSQRSLASF